MIRFETDGATWRALAEVVVGVDHRVMSVDLGRLDETPDPGGLRAVPVVTVAAASSVLVRAGAFRAGKAPAVLLLPASAPVLGRQLLTAVAEGAEVIIVEDGGAEALETVRVLGGRPLPALALDHPAAVAGLLGALTVDVNLALPAAGDDDRADALAVITPYEPGRVHHLVEVDPRPAFDELGWDAGRATLGERAAAATGVLAGRLAAANRRWRA